MRARWSRSGLICAFLVAPPAARPPSPPMSGDFFRLSVHFQRALPRTSEQSPGPMCTKCRSPGLRLKRPFRATTTCACSTISGHRTTLCWRKSMPPNRTSNWSAAHQLGHFGGAVGRPLPGLAGDAHRTCGGLSLRRGSHGVPATGLRHGLRLSPLHNNRQTWLLLTQGGRRPSAKTWYCRRLRRLAVARQPPRACGRRR